MKWLSGQNLACSWSSSIAPRLLTISLAAFLNIQKTLHDFTRWVCEYTQATRKPGLWAMPTVPYSSLLTLG